MTQSHTIFLGSTTEDRKHLEILQDLLNKADFNTLPWHEAFSSGDITLQKILQVARSVDAAVFIGSGSDITRSRKRTTRSVRDNILFELGVFMSALGEKHCIFLFDPEAKIPSDLDGYNYVELPKDGISDIVLDPIIDYLNKTLRAYQQPQPADLTAVVDRDLLEFLRRNNFPTTWHQRLRYIGAQGAANWRAVSHSDSHMSRAARNSVIETYSKCIASGSGTSCRSLISLGPGDGLVDDAVVSSILSIPRANKRLSYIPIDISDGLLLESASRLSKTVSVPAAILADFEENTDYAISSAKKYSTGPRLYSLLGGTIGNLDVKTERTFIQSLARHMDPDDRLLLDCSIKNTGIWEAELDPRNLTNSYSHAYQNFILRHSGSPGRRTPPSESTPFSELIKTRWIHGSPTKNSSRLERVFAADDTAADYLTRYDKSEFIEDIIEASGLRVVDSEDRTFDLQHNEDPVIGVFVALLAPA